MATNSSQLDRLQEILHDPHGDLKQEDRPHILRLLQDLVSETGRLPSCVRILDVTKNKIINSGGEAEIWEATLDGETVVARDLLKPRNRDWSSSEGLEIQMAIRREIISQIQIWHPNVLPICGISSGPDHPLSIITPFAPNGNAFKFLSGVPADSRVNSMLGILTNVASALDYLHVMKPSIVHGDIHSSNILIDAKGNGLLSDFGLARIKHEKTRSKTSILEGGRYRYLAPEVLMDGVDKFRTTPESDCYAFAMTILELATRQKPFAEHDDEFAALNAAQKGDRPKRPPLEVFGELGEKRTNRLWELLTTMWDPNAAKRPSMHVVNRRLGEISAASP
ncbi:kinase-like protein [Clavulina sp. PMI_390]|nr:kinase-like protein [Clavulina sp. PMI_390]